MHRFGGLGSPRSRSYLHHESCSVNDTAVAHTPPGGWTEWPGPILAGCEAPLVEGVHDVAEFDKVTEIRVIATYENGVHVLRLHGMPIEVKLWRDGDHLMWQYLSFTARLEKIDAC